MIHGRVIVIDRFFYQMQPQQTVIEVIILLRVAGHGGDVMKAG
jgi:hypothetical protein